MTNTDGPRALSNDTKVGQVIPIRPLRPIVRDRVAVCQRTFRQLKLFNLNGMRRKVDEHMEVSELRKRFVGVELPWE